MSVRNLLAACEGILDEAVLVRLTRDADLEPSWIDVTRGKVSLDARIGNYASVGRTMRFLALRDMDRDAECAPTLVQRLVPRPTPAFRLHVAVRSIESWLLADAAGLAAELGVPSSRIPSRPDELDDPRAEILTLVRRSRKARLAQELLPSTPGARFGPGYTARFVTFVTTKWDPVSARTRSASLDSLMNYLARGG